MNLVTELWHDLASNPEDIPITLDQIPEVDRRLEEYLKNPDLGYSWEEIERKDALKRRREQRQQARDLVATAREQKRETQRQVDRVILARLLRSGRLGSGRNREDLRARARRILDESSDRERQEIGATLERLIAALNAKRTSQPVSKRRHTRDMHFDRPKPPAPAAEPAFDREIG